MAADFSSWANQMKIEFTGYTKPETLEHFPVLVTFSNRPGFVYSQFLSGSNADLRFSDSTQTNDLSYEIEQWDTNGISLVWVQVPKLVNTNTTIWAYWGKTGQSVPVSVASGSPWDSSFRGVWHLDEPVIDESSTGVHFDSTTNRFNGHQDGNHPVPGVIGSAQDFDGNDKITLGAVMTMNAYTKEAWVKVTAFGNLISSGNSHAFWIPGGNLQSGHNSEWGAVTDPSPFPMGVWQHVAVTYDSAVNSGQLTLYRNGEQVAVATGKVPPNPDEIAYFGSHGGANFFTGQIDEGRISSTARSANWIWASWMNQASNSVFETTTVGVPFIRNDSASGVTANSAILNGLLGSNRMSSIYVMAYWGTNNAGAETKDWQYASAFNGPQAPGKLSKAVSGLVPNQSYFFTYCTSNSAGVAWAQPSLSFKTMGPPVVDNAEGPTIMTDSKVILRGKLLGGRTAYATIYWGTNPTNMTNAIRLGLVEEGLFTVPLAGLNNDAAYHYRCFASNEYGVAWADSTANFSATLSQIIKLEQDADFGKAVVLGTAFLAQGHDAVTTEEIRSILARLKQEKKTALALAFAIESLEAHRDVAERELVKEPEVSALLLRRVLRERDGAMMLNAAAILISMNDPEVIPLVVRRMKTCNDKIVFAALLADLDQLKDQIVPSLAPDVVAILGQGDVWNVPAAHSILTTLAGKDITTNLAAYLGALAARTNSTAAGSQTNQMDRR